MSGGFKGIERVWWSLPNLNGVTLALTCVLSLGEGVILHDPNLLPIVKC